ncbi:MAG: TlpA disulfide reductase family protein [Acidobacteriaceae bacterium]|nr:TlpA disulfide reductase family protein [Acidobacteriaceae bacterium]
MVHRAFVVGMFLLGTAGSLSAQQADPAAIRQEISGLRSVPEKERGARTGAIAHEIAALPAGRPKLGLALGLASLSTEGDPGRDNLQAVTDALSVALATTPVPASKNGEPSQPYMELATLARYEDMKVSGAATENAQFSAAIKLLASQDEEAEKADFTLKDFNGKKWTMSQLRGKIVVLNFWATWCPPCRQELPNLDALEQHYASQGLVVLALTSENAATVGGLFRGFKPHFTVLYDTGGEVAQKYHVNSLPRTYVFNREGKLAAVAMDGRTQQQFLQMLQKAGLQP